MTDHPSNPSSGSTTVPRKRCPQCGHENRLGAKNCTQCGHVFQSMKSAGQKWCPKCGTVNKLEAKVCIQCGRRFRTRFDTPSAPPLPPEPPITQSAPTGIELPPSFDRAHPAPAIPPRKPRPKTDPLPTPIRLDGSANDDDRDAPLAGEPAPDMTDIDYDALRRTPKKDR